MFTSKVFVALAAKSRECVPVSEREPLQQFFCARVKDWEGAFSSFGHWNELDRAHHRLQQQDGMADDVGAMQVELYGECLTGISVQLTDIRTRIKATLEEPQQMAWELGGCIDHGIRPTDVHRHMYQAPHVSDAPPTGTPFITDGKKATDEPLWANREARAGEILPDLIWISDLRQRWDELGLGVVNDFKAILGQFTSESQATQTALVRSLGRAWPSHKVRSGEILPDPVRMSELRLRWYDLRLGTPNEFDEIIGQYTRESRARRMALIRSLDRASRGALRSCSKSP